MKCEQFENKIIISELDSFDIGDILECGQCFRFVNHSSQNIKEYTIIAMERVLHVKQDSESVEFFPCTMDEFESTWKNYFGLDKDYAEIKNTLAATGSVMEEAINFASGIRLLNQDVWECLISFIISQNNRIPMIKQVIKNMSEAFGDKIEDFYAFPTPAQLMGAGGGQIANCKPGFRAKYIMDATERVISGELKIEEFKNMSTPELKEKLMTVHGVGTKVADCVMLFSCGRSEVFPTDVWIKRIMQELYFNGKEVDIKTIHQFAAEKFGSYAGFAQQYLFHYARIARIGAK